MENKKFIIFFLLFLMIGCASIEEMNINASYLDDMKIDRAIKVLGMGPPSSSVILENQRIYVWESAGNMNIPMGGYNYGYDQFGYQVQTWDPNKSSANVPLKCKITIYTSIDFRITDTLVEGDGIQCGAYEKKLEEVAKYVKNQREYFNN